MSDGRVIIHRTFRVGYLEQKGVSGSTATVKEEVTSRAVLDVGSLRCCFAETKANPYLL